MPEQNPQNIVNKLSSRIAALEVNLAVVDDARESLEQENAILQQKVTEMANELAELKSDAKAEDGDGAQSKKGGK